jgi:preprotein translocase subunit SecA
MSGTVGEVADELWRTYRLPVIRIPTHRPVIRFRAPDRYHADEPAKLRAVVERVCEVHAAGRPVLIGTRSVTTSERLGEMLAERGVGCRILNAQRERDEAEIIAAAGQLGAVTVATNMAGRGTDIKLTDQTRALGGLVVIGTERHREHRVDRQLIGRSGRQGDPGLAEMHAAFDDDLVRVLGLPLLRSLARRFPRLGPALCPLLWWQAHLVGSARARSVRAASAQSDSWLEMSIHTMGR